MVGACDLVDDRETQPRTAGVAGARGVEPNERFEYSVAVTGWNARAIVNDLEHDVVLVIGDVHIDMGCSVVHRVVDQIAKHSA